MTEKDALAPTPYLQNNTVLATLSSSTYTHTQGHLRTSPFKTKPLPELHTVIPNKTNMPLLLLWSCSNPSK